MEPKFTIPPENAFNAFFHLLTEIYAQNQVLSEMMLPAYCAAQEISQEEAKNRIQKIFAARKKASMESLHVLFGDISLDDILGDEGKQ